MYLMIVVRTEEAAMKSPTFVDIHFRIAKLSMEKTSLVRLTSILFILFNIQGQIHSCVKYHSPNPVTKNVIIIIIKIFLTYA